MVKSKLIAQKETSEDSTVKEEIKFQYFWYLFVFFSIYLTSLIIPIALFIIYLILFFFPYFLEIQHFLALFTNFKSIMALISMPLVIIGSYLIRLFFIALITRGFWKLTEKKSPSKNGIIPRNFPSRTLNYYHIRGFLIKQGKNSFMKGIFPWLSNWFFNFVGSCKIGKGSTLEESIVNDKFLEIGENCYVGVNSALATHLVDGIFGNISYFKIKVGDNVTTTGMNIVGPGTEIKDNSYLLPLASTPKHSVVNKKKNKSYYWGIPLRKIFNKKIKEYLKLSPKDLERSENIQDYTVKKSTKKVKEQITSVQNKVNYQKKSDDHEEKINVNGLTEEDLRIDFTTSSAISRVNIKFLAVYIPIFWVSGIIITIIFYTYTYYVKNWVLAIIFLPALIIFMWFIFIIGCFFFSKLFLVLINLIHKPKEGVFKAEIGDTDFEFWCLRTELKKIVLWLTRNWPLPWMDILAFKAMGIKMSLTSSMYDSWCDGEFIKMGRRVILGQGCTVMSSMVIGKYLIIKDIILGDYVLIGGHATVAPGSIIGKDSVVGAIGTTTYNQILEPGWIYFGIPVIKLKKNRYSEERRDLLMKRDVDEEKKFEIEHEINIDEN